MKWRTRISPLAVVIVALLALGVHLLLHVPFWIAFGFAFLGLFINGLVAVIEDNRRGGLNDPKGPPSEDS